MLAKDEQIFVSGDDEVGFPRNGRSQYLVDVAVPANRTRQRRELPDVNDAEARTVVAVACACTRGDL